MSVTPSAHPWVEVVAKAAAAALASPCPTCGSRFADTWKLQELNLDFGARCAICELKQIIEDKERCAAAIEAMNAIVDNLMELDKATASDKEERNRQMLARGVKVGFLKSTWSF